MSFIDGVYTNPGWINENAPPVNASNLNDISDAIVQIQSDSGDLANEVANLKGASIDYGSYDICRGMSHVDTVDAHLTYTWNSDGSCTVTGTSTDISFCTMFMSSTSLPTGINAGDHIRLIYSGTNVKVYIYDYSGGSVSTIVSATGGSINFTIPENCTGLIVRLWVANGKTVNETVRPRMYNLTQRYECLDMTLPGPGYIFSDADNITENITCFVSSSGGVPSISNTPYAPGWIKTACAGNNIYLQTMYPYYPETDSVMIRTCKFGTWGDWENVGTDVTYNVTQNINQDTINNSYAITTSPTITTDTNGWLAAIDDETTSQANATDMTGAIMSMLTNTGYCHLGPGVFYVSGNIDMPEDSTLCGCGNDTVVQILGSVTSGYIVQPTARCTIKDIHFVGGDSAPADLYTQGLTDYGSVHGVYLVANADGSTSHTTVSSAFNVLHNCMFSNFDGSAIYMANTGGNTAGYLTASDVNIFHCLIGINIDWYSEYNKFSNIITRQCNIACLNGGGNNVFVGCTFHGVAGFLIDNSASDKYNAGHGTCSGCTFNHIDNDNQPSTLGMGDAIVIKNMNNGFVFTGCQLWYGEIVIEGSRGIQFSNCQIGGNTPTIDISGNYPAFFNNCIFHQTPTITDASGSVFTACYLDADGTVITA